MHIGLESMLEVPEIESVIPLRELIIPFMPNSETTLLISVKRGAPRSFPLTPEGVENI